MTNRTPVPSEFTSEPMVTEPQDKFLSSLIAERDLSKLDPAQQQWLEGYEQNKAKLTKKKASDIITLLLTLPKSAKPSGNLPEIPAGRYAVENNDGELRFYHVWRAKDNNHVVRVYVLHGPDESKLHPGAAKAVMAKIESIGVREAAIRYGMEIKACSNCGRRLTNRISRELGIGPVCGGRMFGEDGWRSEVKAKRAEIVARGEDPDEELE